MVNEENERKSWRAERPVLGEPSVEVQTTDPANAVLALFYALGYDAPATGKHDNRIKVSNGSLRGTYWAEAEDGEVERVEVVREQ